MTQYQHILLEPHGAVMVVRLNRPQVLNALNAPMVAEIAAALEGSTAVNPMPTPDVSISPPASPSKVSDTGGVGRSSVHASGE